jgi:hypothetical protein
LSRARARVVTPASVSAQTAALLSLHVTERSAWTDERLHDRFDQIDRRFDQVDRRFDRLENEMRDGFASVRAEMHEGFDSLRGDFEAFRNLMFRSYVALAIALIAAIVARGF